MAKSSVLGRGLGSLIPNNQPSQYQQIEQPVISDQGERVVEIEIYKIQANPWQPRENFEHGAMEDLISSIKTHGILQPLIVTPADNGQFQLIAGERRLRAATMLEMTTVPCLVRQAEDLMKMEMALIENIQRADLNPIEEARAYKRLMEEFKLTQEQTAERVGKRRTTLANSLRLLDLPQEIQKALQDGQLSAGHAKLILSAISEKEQKKLFEKIISLGLSVRQTESEIKKTRVKSYDRQIGKDLETKEKEDLLRRALGTKVTINKTGSAGQIKIDFYSDEELNELTSKLSNY